MSTWASVSESMGRFGLSCVQTPSVYCSFAFRPFMRLFFESVSLLALYLIGLWGRGLPQGKFNRPTAPKCQGQSIRIVCVHQTYDKIINMSFLSVEQIILISCGTEADWQIKARNEIMPIIVLLTVIRQAILKLQYIVLIAIVRLVFQPTNNYFVASPDSNDNYLIC